MTDNDRTSSNKRITTPADGGRQTRAGTPATEFRNLKRHGGASAAELRTFLNQLRGKSPKEMLGAVASSNLFQSTVRAAFGAAALIAVFTVLPFAWSKLVRRDRGDDAAPLSPSAETVSAGGGETALSPASPGSTATAPPGGDAVEKVSRQLGIGESKDAPPSINPLESANDDLLKYLY
jgi:hypothetical protein